MNFVQRILRSLYKKIGYLFSILWHTAGYQNRVLADTENDDNLSKSSTEDYESDDYPTFPTTEDLEDDDTSTTSSLSEDSENVDNFTRSSTAEDAESGDYFSRSATKDEDNNNNSTTEDLESNNGSTTSPTTENSENEDSPTTFSTTEDMENEDDSTRSPTLEIMEGDDNSAISSTTENSENEDSPTTFSTTEDMENEDDSTRSPTLEITDGDDNSTTSPTTEVSESNDGSTISSTTEDLDNNDNSTRSLSAEDAENSGNFSRSTTEDAETDNNSTTYPTTNDMESNDRSTTFFTTENSENEDSSTTSSTTENDDNSTRLASVENIQPPHLEIDSYEYYRSVNSGLLDAFTECSICLEPLQRGAHACARCGGMWCCQCASELRTCVWCRYELHNKQSSACHALDRLLASLKLPCRNQRNGCPKMLTLAERNLHETQHCEKEPVFCPFTIACHGLNFGEIADHMRDIHNAIIVNSLTVTININIIPNEVPNFDKPYALISNKNVFILKLYFHENRVKIDVVRKSLIETDTESGRHFANIYVTQGVWSWEILDRALDPVKYTTITALLCVDLSRKRMYTICFEIKKLDNIPESAE